EEPIARGDGRWNVGGQALCFGVVPENVAFGRNAHGVHFGEASGDAEDILVGAVDHAGDVLLGRPVDEPAEIAGVRVVRGGALRAAEDHVFDAVDVEDGGVAVGAGVVGAFDAPDLFAG